MVTIVNQDDRFSEAWWNEQVANAVGVSQSVASDYVADADTDGDMRGMISEVIDKAGFKGKLEEVRSLSTAADSEVDTYHVLYMNVHASDLIVDVACYKYGITVRAWANSLKEAQEVVSKITAHFPRKDKPVLREDLIPFAFWHAQRDIADCYIKDIQCPKFEEIEKNYAKVVREQVKWLSALKKPDDFGKIILWHGPPGMGKTYAIRAFARAWSNVLDATVEVILDPEALLNSVGYLKTVLLQDDRPARARRSIHLRKGKTDKTEATPAVVTSSDPMMSILKEGDESDDEDDKDEGIDNRPLRLIIIEDSAELFNDRARQTPGFGRLLNLTDGIIGQGLRCIFLLTANEELGKIDEAIRRPGRCIQTLEFPQFGRAEGQQWLKDQGSEFAIPADQQEISLAYLYSIVKQDNRPPVPSEEKLGFNVG